MPHDWPPPGTCTDPKVPNWCGSVAAEEWVYPERGQLWSYVRNRKVYECPSDIGRKADLIPQSACPSGLTPRDYPLSYSMNHNLGDKNVDVFSNATRRMLLIHENRGLTDYNPDFAINDGTFVPVGHDVPGGVHYSGTTLSYLDLHAVWKPRKALLAERNNGDW